MSTILVTDGEQRASLALVRSLGKSGHKVIVAACRPRSLAGASRYTTGTAVVGNPLEDPQGYADQIAALEQSWRIDVLIPVTDHSLLAIMSSRGSFHSLIPFADLETIRAVSDKALLMERAPLAGIQVPIQVKLSLPGDRAALRTQDLRFPLVIKPGRSVVYSDGQLLRLGVIHAANAVQLDDALAAIHPDAYPLLLQQRIIGPGIGMFLLVWNGVTQAVFAHRRIREKPPSGGVSVYRESIAASPELVKRSRALLDRFQWQGVAMIEYKVQESDGTPYLMEINGRFWGSLQLAIDAGVDFPDLLVQLAQGENVKPVTSYRVGIRSRWWWGDVDHLLARLRKSDATLSLPPGSPGRLRTLASFALPWRPGDRSEILRLDDPKPFLRETVEWLRGR
jgi:predicted ATP-grasp superfamily ATP-dependent carboligase